LQLAQHMHLTHYPCGR